MSAEFQTAPILQSATVDPPWALPGGARLPGTGPVAADDWILVDEAFTPQMALRDRLISRNPHAVHALRPEALSPAKELLRMVIAILRDRADYTVADDRVFRPDGTPVTIDGSIPLRTIGCLVQEDLCLLQKEGTEHVMTGAILCFPASWKLSEKLGRPLTWIHAPVHAYDENIAPRVERLFTALRPGTPLMRSNCLLYSDAALFQPRSEDDRRPLAGPSSKYVRFERQCLVRLPETGAVAFSIHTTVVERESLDPSERKALDDYLRHMDSQEFGRLSVI